jgi:hypothetical protein
VEITVEIDDQLFEQVSALGLKEGVTLRVLADEGLRAVIEARIKQSSGPFQLRDGCFQGGRLQAGVSWTDLTKLAYLDEPVSLHP